MLLARARGQHQETITEVLVMSGMKSLLFKAHLPAAVEDEALVDRSIDEAFFGPNDPRVAPIYVDAERARDLINDMWGEILTEDACMFALARFLGRYDDTGNFD
jgi:hypothetical protein